MQNYIDFLDGVDPDNAIPRDVFAWRSFQIKEEKAAASTINTRLAAVRSYYRWSKGEDNPAQNVSNVEITKGKPKSLSKSEQRDLLRAFDKMKDWHGGMRDVAIVEMFLGTGLRAEEMLELQIEDIEIRDKSGSVTVRAAKGAKMRKVPLPLNTRRALSRFLSEKHPDPDNPKSALWHGQRGEFKDTSTFFRMLAKYAYHARLEPFGPHVLRHTFAYNYLEENPGDIRGLAKLLGHEDIRTTMMYTEPRMEDLQNRVENL
jgi:site-specific recombinase XerD